METSARSDLPPEALIEILFENSEVKIGAESFRIKRHYSQRIDGSPLTDEVKIELSGNSVIWLSPVDAGGTWSKIWTGMIVEPKRGVVLSVSHSLYCARRADAALQTVRLAKSRLLAGGRAAYRSATYFCCTAYKGLQLTTGWGYQPPGEDTQRRLG